MKPILEEFIFYSRKIKTVDSLFSLYENALYFYGFDHIACTITSDHPELHSNALGIIHFHNFNGWDQHYLENNFMAIDPTPRLTIINPGIFSWQQIETEHVFTKEQSRIFKETQDFRLFNGHSFSVHGSNGTRFVTLASSSQRSKLCNQYMLDSINMMSQQFYMCFLSLMEFPLSPKMIDLTLKEKEILKWVAKGLTKSDISERINISTHTVDYHTRNILKKLDSKNIAMALAIAVHKGLITI